MTKPRLTHCCRLSAIVIALALPLGGCDWFAGQSADTQMRNVEILPGSASDEMITLDQASGDGTSLDTSTTAGPVVPGAPSVAEDEDTSAAGADAADTQGQDDTSNNGDVIIRPPSGGAEPAEPTK